MVATPNRGYTLQATGSNPGSWGIVLNNQVFSVIDLNLGGRYTPDVSGNSDVTPTASQAQNIYHHLTGVLTGNIDYILPATGGDYVIFNDTTGAFTVTVKPVGGTGLVVPQTGTTRVFINPDTTSAVPGGGVVIVSGGGLEFSAGALRRSALTGAVTAPAGSNTTTLATQSDLTILSNISGGSAVPSANTLTGILDAILGSTQGTIPYRGVSAWSGIAYASREVGEIISFAGASAPAKWLLCYGQNVSRTTYSALFAVINTVYGTGDGSTTFGIPDLRGRVVAGKDNMGGSAANRLTSAISGLDGTTLGAAGGDQSMQAHTHTYNAIISSTALGPGSSYGTSSTPTGSTGAGNSQNVQPTMMLNKIIYVGT